MFKWATGGAVAVGERRMWFGEAATVAALTALVEAVGVLTTLAVVGFVWLCP